MVTVEHPDQSLTKGICQAGTTRLQAHLMGVYGLGNSGCYNPNSTLTSGAPSFHTTGEAFDLTCNYFDQAQRAKGDAVFDWLYIHREQLNLQQIIFGHRIWSSFHQVISQYNHSDHTNHLHCSLGRTAALNWSINWLVGQGTGVTPPPIPPPVPQPEEDEVSDSFFYPADGLFHRLYPRHGDIIHAYGTKQENLSKHFRDQGVGLGPIDDNWQIQCQIRPNSLGKWIDCMAIAGNDTGFIVYFQYEFQGKGWHVISITPPPA